jgi:hypothetical protein
MPVRVTAHRLRPRTSFHASPSTPRQESNALDEQRILQIALELSGSHCSTNSALPRLRILPRNGRRCLSSPIGPELDSVPSLSPCITANYRSWEIYRAHPRNKLNRKCKNSTATARSRLLIEPSRRAIVRESGCHGLQKVRHLPGNRPWACHDQDDPAETSDAAVRGNKFVSDA